MPSSMAMLLGMIVGNKRAIDVFQSTLRVAVGLFQIPEDLAFVRIADPKSGETKNYTTLSRPFASNYLNDLSGITGRAMKSRQPQRVADVKRDADFVVYVAEEEQGRNHGPTRSELAVPLMFGDECYGVMNFESPQKGWFEESDIQWALLLGTVAAFSEHQEQSLDESPGHIPFIDASIREQVGALLDEVLLKLSLPADAMAEVMLYADRTQDLLTLEIKPPTSAAFHRRLQLGEGLTGRYFTSQQSYAGPVNLRSNGNNAHLLSSRSVLIVPLTGADKPIGVLNMESPNPEALTPAQLELVTASDIPTRIERILAKIDVAGISQDQVKKQLIDELRRHIFEAVGTDDPRDIYTQILRVASRVVDADNVSGGLILIRDEQQNLSKRGGNLADLYAVRAARIGAFASAREWSMDEPSIAKRVITTLTTARVGNVKDDPDYKDSGTGYAESSELIVPLVNSDKKGIGVIGLVSPGLNRFSASDQEYLESVASIAGYAIQRSEEIRQIRRQADQLALQGDLLKLIEEELFLRESQSGFNPQKVDEIRETIFGKIVEWAVKYTKSEHTAIVLVQTTEGRGQYLSVVAKTPSALVPDAPTWWPKDEGVTGEAFSTGRTINSRDNQALSDTSYVPYFLAACSEVAVPIRIGDTTLGVFDVESNTPFHYTNHYIQWAEFLAQQLAFVLTVIENASRRRFETALVSQSHKVDIGIREMPSLHEWNDVRLLRNRLIREIVQKLVDLTGAQVGRMIMAINAYNENGDIDLINGQFVYLASTDARELEGDDRYFPITNGVTGRAFTQQRDIVYNDKESRPAGYFDSDPTRDCHSGIFVPVLEGTQGVGILDIESLDEGTFSPDAVQAVHQASELISNLLVAARQRLNELLNQRLLQFEREILLSLSADKGKFMQQVLESAAPIADLYEGWGAVVNFRPWGNQEKPLVDITFTATYAKQETMYKSDNSDHSSPTHPALLRAIATKKPVLILGTAVDGPIEQLGLPWKNAAVGSLISVPLLKPVGEEGKIDTQVVGLLVLASPRQAEFSEPDKYMLTTYAETIIGAMKNVAALDVSKNLLGELRHDADAALIPLLIELEELNEPMQYTLNSAEAAGLRTQLIDIQQRVRHIYSLSRLVSDTLNALFDFSNNDLVPEISSVSIQVVDVISPMHESVNELARQKKREVVWEPVSDLKVYGGASRSKMMQAVLFKFLDNAIKYADPGTPITVRCGSTESTVSVEVMSHGKLVPADEREAIWSLEYRGSNVAKGTSGAGQGLYQARVIAQRLSGQATYVPKDPDRNIFALVLPLAP